MDIIDYFKFIMCAVTEQIHDIAKTTKNKTTINLEYRKKKQKHGKQKATTPPKKGVGFPKACFV